VWDTASWVYIKNLGMSKEDVFKNFTSKIPLKRLAKITDIVEVTYFMSSQGAGYMTGQAINVDGGREMH
jgi:NAD(P)-dependent dehydrogenase (short-subunit alcohol dehydrogenase family)